MKVSSNINVTTIYQNQLKKLQEAKSGDFDKMLHGASSDESVAGADSKGLSGLKSNKTDKVDWSVSKESKYPRKPRKKSLCSQQKPLRWKLKSDMRRLIISKLLLMRGNTTFHLKRSLKNFGLRAL
jgi:hypothetical protein